MKMSTASSLISDLPKGPLDIYRKRATFDWKSFKLNLDGEDCVRFQTKLWEFIKTNAAFKKPSGSITLDELRKHCNAQIQALHKSDIDVINIIILNITIMLHRCFIQIF